MSANSVSALAYRAREGLRQAFLTMHIADLADDGLPLGQRAPRRLRPRGLSKRDAGKVEDAPRRAAAAAPRSTSSSPRSTPTWPASSRRSCSARPPPATSLDRRRRRGRGARAAGEGQGVRRRQLRRGHRRGCRGRGGDGRRGGRGDAGRGPANKQVVADPPASVSTTPAAPAPSLPRRLPRRRRRPRPRRRRRPRHRPRHRHRHRHRRRRHRRRPPRAQAWKKSLSQKTRFILLIMSHPTLGWRHSFTLNTPGELTIL